MRGETNAWESQPWIRSHQLIWGIFKFMCQQPVPVLPVVCRPSTSTRRATLTKAEITRGERSMSKSPTSHCEAVEVTMPPCSVNKPACDRMHFRHIKKRRERPSCENGLPSPTPLVLIMRQSNSIVQRRLTNLVSGPRSTANGEPNAKSSPNPPIVGPAR